MRKTEREKIIKKLIDEEFGPNLSADELCSEIDFTQRKGIKIVHEEKKPFFKRPVFMCLANVCLILVCILSTFLITRNNVKMDFESSLHSILETSEIKYLNDNNYKYYGKVNNILNFDKVNLYIFIVKKDGENICFVKYKTNEKNIFNFEIKTNNNRIELNSDNDMQIIGILDKTNSITFQIEYLNVINSYTMQFNE